MTRAAPARVGWVTSNAGEIAETEVEVGDIALSHFCYRRRKTLVPQGPRKLPKLDVAGSTPVARSFFLRRSRTCGAGCRGSSATSGPVPVVVPVARRAGGSATLSLIHRIASMIMSIVSAQALSTCGVCFSPRIDVPTREMLGGRPDSARSDAVAIMPPSEVSQAERHGLGATHGVYEKLEHVGEHLALALQVATKESFAAGASCEQTPIQLLREPFLVSQENADGRLNQQCGVRRAKPIASTSRTCRACPSERLVLLRTFTGACGTWSNSTSDTRNLRTKRLVRLFDSAGDVHRVTDHRELPMIRMPHHPDDERTTMRSDADLERRSEFGLPARALRSFSARACETRLEACRDSSSRADRHQHRTAR